MNFLYSTSPETEKNTWGYDSDVGIISKIVTGTEKDAEQDQNIESNKQMIQQTEHELRINEQRDDVQQTQIDENAALDAQQQIQIDSNRDAIAANAELDAQQQIQIDANRDKLIYVESELPTLNMDNTTLIIGKKGAGE